MPESMKPLEIRARKELWISDRAYLNIGLSLVPSYLFCHRIMKWLSRESVQQHELHGSRKATRLFKLALAVTASTSFHLRFLIDIQHTTCWPLNIVHCGKLSFSPSCYVPHLTWIYFSCKLKHYTSGKDQSFMVFYKTSISFITQQQNEHSYRRTDACAIIKACLHSCPRPRRYDSIRSV